jgi:3-deoxy-D-manno-octulosonate 8-phosphate phosphatase (KDO 8-P phosphatase)
MIKLVVLDIDGVMTDGTKAYGANGMPFAKCYCDKDFTAIKRLRGAGVKVCFLSGDETINKKMASNRKIDFYSSRGKDKSEFIALFEETYKVSPSEMAYVGDDLFDLSIMQSVGYPYCPSDACQDVKDFCSKEGTLPCMGGKNVISYFVEVLLDLELIPDCTMDDIERLDKLEVF